MKKLFVLFVLMAGCFAFAACSDDSSDAPKPEEPGTEQPGEENPGEELSENWTITIDVQNIIRSDVSESADLAECNKCKFKFNAEAVIDSVDWGTGNGWESAQEYCERYNDYVTLSSDTYPRTDPDKVYSVKIKGHEELSSIRSSNNMLIVNCNFGDYTQNMESIYFYPTIISSFNLDEYPILEYLYLGGSSSREPQLEFIGSNQSLKELSLSGYSIDELDLSNNANLTEFEAYNIHANNINLSNCTNLVKFTGHIFVDAIDFSNCTSLEEIEIPKYYVTESEIKNLNISGCSVLKSLDAYGISMTSLDLSNCAALEELYCSDNNLNKLALDDCTALEILSCGGNNLNELKLETCVSLEELYCSYNQLTTLDVRKCLSLTSINCSDNPITDLDISGLSSLKNISCSWEGMVSFNASNCSSWEETNFSSSDGYDFYRIGPSSTLTDVILDNCTALFPKLEVVGENLKSLSMKNCTRILRLSVDNNPKLASLNIEGCTSLNQVQCYNNNFTGEMMNKIFTDLPIEEDGIIYCDGIGDPSIAEEKGWTVEVR